MKKSKRIALLAFFGILFITISSFAAMLIWPRVSFEGSIVSVSDGLLMIEVIDSHIENGLYFVPVDDDTVIKDSSSNIITLGDISVGTQVKITFDGYIYESSPGRVRKCYKIRIMD